MFKVIACFSVGFRFLTGLRELFHVRIVIWCQPHTWQLLPHLVAYVSRPQAVGSLGAAPGVSPFGCVVHTQEGMLSDSIKYSSAFLHSGFSPSDLRICP